MVPSLPSSSLFSTPTCSRGRCAPPPHHLHLTPSSSTSSTSHPPHHLLHLTPSTSPFTRIHHHTTTPVQVELFWAQHLAMLLVPLLLAWEGSTYTPTSSSCTPASSSCSSASSPYSPATSFYNSAALSYSVFFLYHLVVLQPLALATGVNLDFVLCPAPKYKVMVVLVLALFVLVLVQAVLALLLLVVLVVLVIRTPHPPATRSMGRTICCNTPGSRPSPLPPPPPSSPSPSPGQLHIFLTALNVHSRTTGKTKND